MEKKAEILYEPMPIGRIGVRKKDKEVVVVKDFSTFAFMLEEYISYGAVNIVLPQSSPEIATLGQMPPLLQKRIKIINDDKEREVVNRLLFSLRKEFNVEFNEENGILRFKKECPHQLIKDITLIHNDTKKLAIGFNHEVQIGINTRMLTNALVLVRRQITDPSCRIILAQLEAIVKQYSDFNIDAITPPRESTPIELISIFDKLINDPLYIEYSSSVATLNSFENRRHLLAELRNQIRLIGSKKYLGTGWDYVTKIIKLFTPIILPDSKAIASLINDKNFPVLVNMDSAKNRVFENWRVSCDQNMPLSRDGSKLANEQIAWVPFTESVDVSGGDGTFVSIGKVKDVLKILTDFQSSAQGKK